MIASDNEVLAEDTQQELARILIKTAQQVLDHGADNKTQSILDTNGNRIGSWKLEVGE
jgi:hypothetical protein